MKKKNRAPRQSAMSELLSKSNTVSTCKKESDKPCGTGRRIYVQSAKVSQKGGMPLQFAQTSPKKVVPPRSARTGAKSDKRTIRTSFKIAHAVVTTAVLMCICTGIISAVLILNPGEENGTGVDATIGVPSIVCADVQTGAEEIIEERAAQEEALLAADAADCTALANADGRHTVTFTFYDQESLVCTSGERTVGELTDLMGIQLSDEQLKNVNTEATIQADTVISVDAVTYETVAVNAPIAYETRYVDVQTIPKGTTKTYQKGANGTQTTEYQVTYVNGIEVGRVQTNEYTSVVPTENVVYRGVGGTLTVGGKTYSYSYYIDCDSTVYTGGGTTASGLPATEKVIAVDPKVIPLGTTCYISGSYCEVGFRTAADVGGGIKGNIVDVYFEKSNPYFAGYGRRNVRVYIFN